MAPKTVLIATEKPFASSAVQSIEGILKGAGYNVRRLEKYTSHSQLLEAIADVDAAIVRSDKVDKEFFGAAKNLKLVVRAGTGIDTIDVDEATKHSVVVMNTPGQNSNAVAELAFGMMVMHVRNHFDGTSGSELKGKTLALYGCGNVSRCMATVAKGFGMSVISHDPFLSDEDIKAAGATPVSSVADLFSANFVSLHIPGTAETKNSINKDLLGKLPKNGVLINTARKDVIHESDLFQMITKDRPDIGYLADVPPDNLEAIKTALGENEWKKNIFVTPKKMGAQTSEANNNAGIAAANQLVGFFEKNETRFAVNGRAF